MPSPPDASIVIAQRNQSPFLAEAIESALAQTGCSIEVIVVDDGSDDDSPAIAGRYPGVVLIEQQQQGACVARNVGIARSTGRHLVFLDGDDRMLPNAVEAGLSALAGDPECGMAYGSFNRISAGGAYLSTAHLPTSTVDHFAHFLTRNPIVLHAALFRRDVVERFGGFVAEDWLAADWDLYLKTLRDYPAVCHGEVIAERRIHPAQASRSDAPTLASAIRVQNRQWRHVRRDPVRRAALLAGRKHYQDWFGERLVTEAHLAAAAGRWSTLAARLLNLLRYYPRGAIALLRGLRKSNRLVFKVLPDGAAAIPSEPGPVTMAPVGLVLSELQPPASVRDQPLPHVRGDHGVLSIVCRNATSSTVVIFDGAALESDYLGENLLQAFVPPHCLRIAGDKQVYLLK